MAMLAGVSTAVVWRLLEWHNMLYEGLPGILVGLTVALLYSSAKANQPGFAAALLRKT